MLTRTFPAGFTLLLFTLALAAGCGESGPENPAATDTTTTAAPSDHADPHDKPLTDEEIEQLRQETTGWRAAVSQIQEYRDKIQQETTRGVPAKAHRSLDLLDHLLSWLPEIARNNNVPKENWQTIGEASQQLRDLFNQVHANIDEGQDPGYPAVAAEIDKSIKELAAIEAPESQG